jgi:serine-type D-Ala-D-Ala carboxypeptidase/endopeptidase (penicillin-binding protein 4)
MRLPLTATVAFALALLLLASVRAPAGAAGKRDRAGKGDRGRLAAAARASDRTRQGLPARVRPAPPVGAASAAKTGKSLPAAAATPAGGDAGLEMPAPGEQDPDRDRILRLQESLASIIHGPVLGRMRVGIRVIEAGTGRTFFRQLGSTLMDPASNQKVLATTAALMRLGADYRFRTEMTGPAPDADGVVAGDIVLRGSGDPSLEVSELEAMAGDLWRRGVIRVEGSVVTDPRRLGARETAADERSPLRISRSALLVRVKPGAEGAPPSVTVRPNLEAIVIRNRAVTKGKARGRVRVTLTNTSDGRMTVEVTGTISPRHPGMVMSRLPTNQRLYAAALMRAALIEAGIEVKGGAKVAPATGPTAGKRDTLLAVHHSEPLTVIIRRVNKDSNNEWAERLLETVGAEIYGGPATQDKGLRALREAMDEVGLTRESYVPTNGSGLGHTNRLTPDAIAELLQKLYTDPRWGPELLQSLSVGGVDGTIRNRFRGSPAAERVRAKTGTLNGKSCLSGYVGDGQEVLVFSILVEGLRGRRFVTSAVRAAQVSAVNAMMRYARGVLEAPAGEEPLPGTDYEAGEEIFETDEESPAAPGTPGATPAPGAAPPVSGPGGPTPGKAPASGTPSGAARGQPPAGLRPARLPANTTGPLRR